MKTRLLAAAFAAALLPLSAAADAIMAVDPFAFAPAASAKTSGAYVSLKNTGPADTLIGVASDVAARTELHESLMQDGVMKMRAVESVDLPHGGEIVMAPGGYHIMLMGLKRPLLPGDSVPITLTFGSGATLVVDTPVKARDGAPAHSGHGHSDHGHSGHDAPDHADHDRHDHGHGAPKTDD
ncbi:copper chaperone PCu(A)C [Pikeienuella sp. HZG-20]|uniref:copper chaperone PCu(A)C n=1 Tax=Paludibacillus litoralis TaxID=3133267 RepID=UPI0030EEE181